MFEEANSEALHAVEVFEKLGAVKELERCRWLLRKISTKINRLVATNGSDFNGEFLETVPLPAHINFPLRSGN